jgi:hypothetical protein
MDIVAMILFGCSLVGICGIFTLKSWEVRHERMLAPHVRSRLDGAALGIKHQLFQIRLDVARIPPLTVWYTRVVLHKGALGFAAFARMSEYQAHRLAELVSHKRTSTPRETRSEFLKKVSEHKSENGLDSRE